MTNINFEKLLSSWMKRTQYKHLIDELNDALAEQNFKYVDGEIIEVPPIKKGDWFLCIKTVYMNPDYYSSEEEKEKYAEKAYLKGHIYHSDLGDCITDEDGDKNHVWMTLHGKYFKKIDERPKFNIGDIIKVKDVENTLLYKITGFSLQPDCIAYEYRDINEEGKLGYYNYAKVTSIDKLYEKVTKEKVTKEKDATYYIIHRDSNVIRGLFYTKKEAEEIRDYLNSKTKCNTYFIKEVICNNHVYVR